MGGGSGEGGANVRGEGEEKIERIGGGASTSFACQLGYVCARYFRSSGVGGPYWA